MDYFLLIADTLIVFYGIYVIYISVKQLQLNQYLRRCGLLTSAVITEVELTKERDSYISRLKVTFQDERHRTYDAHFAAKDSAEEYLYLVGGEVLIYYDPLQPERSALAAGIDSSWSFYAQILFGFMCLACGFHLLQETLTRLHWISQLQ
ncbi:DUF3592 domain-containing protein [Hymenobacter sp. ISL-91]|uniref:DUF3592 domain-containing protein n=1 Tax=Hymenobacter sp. ISL-91 TaxID=2819151 RepID=UPI001BE6A8D6|nr:DUF3592 domain-containing protein [Hymenobacter sp. ISL-91]MBT2557701.1 DUF3592 domain-containing protein [Hymenobacter sp. ISL-91]